MARYDAGFFSETAATRTRTINSVESECPLKNDMCVCQCSPETFFVYIRFEMALETRLMPQPLDRDHAAVCLQIGLNGGRSFVEQAPEDE